MLFSNLGKTVITGRANDIFEPAEIAFALRKHLETVMGMVKGISHAGPDDRIVTSVKLQNRDVYLTITTASNCSSTVVDV